MNHIEVKRIKTCYDYQEHYWIIDGTPITFYLDRHRPDGYSSLLGLMPAWNGELLSQWENDFVWEMVDSQQAVGQILKLYAVGSVVNQKLLPAQDSNTISW